MFNSASWTHEQAPTARGGRWSVRLSSMLYLSRSGLHGEMVRVAPEPLFTRLEGLDNGVPRLLKMPSGMLVLGGVAAADVAAFEPKDSRSARLSPPRSPAGRSGGTW